MKLATNTSLRYGLFIYLGMVAYFFIMKLFGLQEITELRVFNFFIVLIGLYKLLQYNIQNKGETNYGKNFLSAIKASFFSVLLFSISMVVYLEFINPRFMSVLEHSKIWGSNLSVIQLSMAILVEGTASTFMIAFLLMQYFKSKNQNSYSVQE